MPIRTATLSRSKNGDFVSRKGIPQDVREAYTRLWLIGASVVAVSRGRCCAVSVSVGAHRWSRAEAYCDHWRACDLVAVGAKADVGPISRKSSDWPKAVTACGDLVLPNICRWWYSL